MQLFELEGEADKDRENVWTWVEFTSPSCHHGDKRWILLWNNMHFWKMGLCLNKRLQSFGSWITLDFLGTLTSCVRRRGEVKYSMFSKWFVCLVRFYETVFWRRVIKYKYPHTVPSIHPSVLHLLILCVEVFDKPLLKHFILHLSPCCRE